MHKHLISGINAEFGVLASQYLSERIRSHKILFFLLESKLYNVKYSYSLSKRYNTSVFKIIIAHQDSALWYFIFLFLFQIKCNVPPPGFPISGFHVDAIDQVVLNLQDEVQKTWHPGDQIVVASTDYSMHQAEEFTLLPCPHCSSRQVRIQGKRGGGGLFEH